jgi:hypothetical protein
VSKSRRADGKPETDADKRRFELRESGYRGAIDQDGRPVDWREPRWREAASTITRIQQAQRSAARGRSR